MNNLTDMTMLQLFDAAVEAALNSGSKDGGAVEVAEIRAALSRRLFVVFREGSPGGRIQSLIGRDVLDA
jgi:hypothetical protein